MAPLRRLTGVPRPSSLWLFVGIPRRALWRFRCSLLLPFGSLFTRNSLSSFVVRRTLEILRIQLRRSVRVGYCSRGIRLERFNCCFVFPFVFTIFRPYPRAFAKVSTTIDIRIFFFPEKFGIEQSVGNKAIDYNVVLCVSKHVNFHCRYSFIGRRIVVLCTAVLKRIARDVKISKMVCEYARLFRPVCQQHCPVCRFIVFCKTLF